jgi:hypothetical protein
MACDEYARLANKTTTDSTFSTSVYTDGIQCLASHSDHCKDACADPLAHPNACYNCMTNPALCPDSSDGKKACCPFIRQAIACSRCLTGSSTCAKKMSSGVLAGIIVGSILGAALIVLTIVLLVKRRSKNLAHEDILDTSRERKIDSNVLLQLAKLDVDTDVLRKVAANI